MSNPLRHNSGKSTFLHSLAGRVKQDAKISLSGRRYINGVPVTGDTQIPAAFIEQDVNFFPHLTVKETLDFRVELQLASVLRSQEERDDLVAKLMSDLGLTKSANTIVGNTKVRGLSGGERKRLSIACQMIDGNSVLMLDEPTRYVVRESSFCPHLPSSLPIRIQWPRQLSGYASAGNAPQARRPRKNSDRSYTPAVTAHLSTLR